MGAALSTDAPPRPPPEARGPLSSESSLVPSGRRRHRPKSFSSAQRWTREGGRLCRVKPAEPMPPTVEPIPPVALLRDSGLVLRGAPRREVAATRMPSYLLGTCIGMTNEDPDAIEALRYHSMRSTRLICRLVCRAWALAVRTGAAWSCAHVRTKSLDRIHPDVAPYIRRLKLPYTHMADDAIPPVVSICSQFPRLESLDISGSARPTSFPALSQLRQLKALNLGYINRHFFSDDEWMAAERLLPKSLEVLYINHHSLGIDLPSLVTLCAGIKLRELTSLAGFRCPRLVELDLSVSCRGYDDSSLELIVEACPNIRWLDISKCAVSFRIGAILSRMTSLRFLCARCLFDVRALTLACPALEQLVVGGKDGMRRQRLDSLDVSACPRLRIVSARYLDGLRTLCLSSATVSLDLSHGSISADLIDGVLFARGASFARLSLIGTPIDMTMETKLGGFLRRLQARGEIDVDMPDDLRKFVEYASTAALPLLEVRGLLPQPYPLQFRL